MKKGELYDLRDAIKACENLSGAKFCYALAKNLNAIESEIKLIEKARHKPSTTLEEYSKLEMEIMKNNAKKDEAGEFIIKNNFYVFDDPKFVNAEIKALKEKYPEAIEESKKAVEDFKTLLDSDADYKPFYIKLDDVDNNITSQQMNGISILFE